MSHTVEIISVGTELLLGNVVNLDAQIISQKLSELGLNVYYHTVVGDNPGRLKQAVAIAKGRADILITTGGLGPTCDDLTKQTLAEAFSKKLVFHQDIADELRTWFEKRGHPMTENNLQQAQLPEGCTVFPNDRGTAPGCVFEAEGKHVLMLPGPPSECRNMFEKQAVPYLSALGEGVIVSHTLKIFGMGESAVEDLLREQMNTMTNPTLAPYAKEGECELRLTAKAADTQTAEALLAPAVKQLQELLGDVVYGVDVPNLETAVLDLLHEQGLTLSTAESCTGGLIAKRLTDIPGASASFKGAVVSYCDQVKDSMLAVPAGLLRRQGAVSREVAEAMARGARKYLGSDIALAVTGVAGPGSDERGNPPGRVYIALSAPDMLFVRTMNLSGAPRERVRITAANHALDLARRYLSQKRLEADFR